MKQATTDQLNKLQALRPNIPVYVYFGAVRLTNFLTVQKDLAKAPEGVQEEVDIVLDSAGGQTDVAYKLIKAFRKKYKVVNVIVPSWAKSAATLFAFGATRLVIHEYGELGPIDTQVKKDVETDPEGEWSSAVSVQASLMEIEDKSKNGVLEMFRKLRGDKSEENKEILNIGRTQLMEMLLDYSAKFYEPLLSKVDVNELGKMARNLNEGKMYAKRILTQYGAQKDEVLVEKLINFLTYDCPDHGYVVDYDLLQPYLPHVIKPNEAPFTAEYDKELGVLSLQLTSSTDPGVGFLKDLTPKAPTATIQTNGTRPTATTPGATSGTATQGGQTGKPSSRP